MYFANGTVAFRTRFLLRDLGARGRRDGCFLPLAAAQRRPIGTGKPASTSEPVLRVSEIFGSIQGEGPFSGRPSVFLRLGQCNLSCAWCDTPYTWLFTEDRLEKVRRAVSHSGSVSSETLADVQALKVYDKKAELERIPVSDVQARIESLAGTGTRTVVITGGEPLLHMKPLRSLVPRLLESGYDVEFETNGTITPRCFPGRVHFNVSPKLSNSCQSEESRLDYGILQEMVERPSAVFKFVVAQERDLKEILAIVKKTAIDPSRVYLMPQGKASSTLRDRAPWLVEVCREYGFRYSHRVHVEIWGDKRGV